MKIYKSLFTILLLSASFVTWSQQSYDLRTLAQESHISIKDSQVVVNIDGARSTYPVRKADAQKQWTFKNQQDAQAFLKLLGVSTEEIEEKWGHTLPNTTDAEKLITIAANNSQGITLKKFEEEGGMLLNDMHDNTPNASITRTEGNPGGFTWLWIAIIGSVGLLIGYFLGKYMRGNDTGNNALHTASKDDEEVQAFEAAVVASPKDPVKITQVAKDKIAKLQADVKQLKQQDKQQKAQLATVNQQLTQVNQFHKVYFQQALKQYITPYNEAVEKGNKAEVMQLLLQIAAHFSSLAKHELELKQDYDTVNVNTMLKVQDSNNLQQFPIIDGQTALDRVPHHVKVLLSIMKENQVTHLPNTIVYGYRIQP